ncbi:unnamed protein product, partial [Mesorhabditis spiculigera]
MPRSMVSELDWPNLTTTAQTIPGLGCQLTVPIGLINATTVDVSISGREIRSERVRYLYLLNPGIWAPDQTFYQGMLYGYQISAAFIDLAMWCQQDECNIVKSLDFALSNAVTCRLQAFDFAPKETCSGQACFYRFDKITGVLEMGCFWQDWTQAEGQLQVGFYSLFASAGFYICAEDLCNVDIATVNASIQNCKPKYPPYKGQGVETWAEVETALSSGEYSFICKTPPATTTIPTTIAQKAEESPTNSPLLETTTKSGHQKVFGLSYLVLVMLYWLNLSTLEATSMGMACSVEGTITDYCNNFNSIDALFHNVVTCQTQMFASTPTLRWLNDFAGCQAAIGPKSADTMVLIFILALVDQVKTLKCVVDQKAPDFLDESPKSTCLGDTCWLFYDPALQQYARDCLTGITREPGCRRAIVNQKADSYLCYCNHSAKCNAEFPVFHENNQTVTWAEKSLPNTDVIPQMLTCGNEAFPELTIPINAAPTVDWLNVTTATITKEAPGCYINGDIKMPRDENFTVTFRTDYIAKSRQAYLFALDPTIWIADMPILFPGSLYATQFLSYIQDVQKFCREVTYRLIPVKAKHASCDMITRAVRMRADAFGKTGRQGKLGLSFVNWGLFPQLQAFRGFYHISTDWSDDYKDNIEAVVFMALRLRFLEPNSTCIGDLCWRFYDPIQDAWAGDCMVGIDRSPGCRRIMNNGKPDTYLCYCNHTDNCNKDFPVFDGAAKTVLWAGASLPNADLLLLNYTCNYMGASKPWRPCLAQRRANSETMITIGFRSGVIPGQRMTYVYRLDPMFYLKNYVPFYTGALWATRSDIGTYLPIKYCAADHCNTVRSMGATVRNDVTCEMQHEQNITLSICTGQACYLRYDPLRRIYEKGCYWQDWTTGEGQVAIGFYSLLSTKKSKCTGELCWLLYDPVLNEHSRDCMSGINREPGCRRLFQDNKPDTHTDNCNAEFPVFNNKNGTVGWAGAILPFIDISPPNITCGSEHEVKENLTGSDLKTTGWNASANLAPRNGLGCVADGSLYAVDGDLYDLRLLRLYVKNDGHYKYAFFFWSRSLPTPASRSFALGSLYGVQSTVTPIRLIKSCIEEFCNVAFSVAAMLGDGVTCVMVDSYTTEPKNCTGSACYLNWNKLTGFNESGCWWEDWTAGDSRFEPWPPYKIAARITRHLRAKARRRGLMCNELQIPENIL